MANSNPSKPFTKGDPRINRKGRPKSFDGVRELAQAIANEQAMVNKQPFVIDGHIATVIEAILRQWATSNKPQLQQAFVAYAYGIPPQRSEHTGADGGALKLEVEYVNNPYPTTPVSPRASRDTQKAKED